MFYTVRQERMKYKINIRNEYELSEAAFSTEVNKTNKMVR